MIDLVYTLGKCSKWDNNEIRYSLRSVEKHLKNYRYVFIIGECPDWIQNVIHVPVIETGHASQNIMQKLLKACDIQILTDEFLFMNDDFFFLKDADAPTYPYYYDGELSDHIRQGYINWYHDYINETITELKAKKLSKKYFDIHTPIIYGKYLFPMIMKEFDFSKKLIVKSIYANQMNFKGEHMKDLKIKGWFSKSVVNNLIRNKPIFSTGDICFQELDNKKSAVKEILQELFPNKSKFEI